MSRYSRILAEHKSRLFDKGYEEESLNAVEPSGTMFALLQAKLLEVLLDTFLSDTPVAFSVPMAGYFDDRRDKVLFEFCYAYDPERSRLQLLKLVAHLRDAKMEFPVLSNNPRDLPCATKVYQKLVQQHPQQPAAQTPRLSMTPPTQR